MRDGSATAYRIPHPRPGIPAEMCTGFLPKGVSGLDAKAEDGVGCKFGRLRDRNKAVRER